MVFLTLWKLYSSVACTEITVSAHRRADYHCDHNCVSQQQTINLPFYTITASKTSHCFSVVHCYIRQCCMLCIPWLLLHHKTSQCIATSEACNNFSFPDCQTEFSSSVSPHMVDLVGEALPQHPLPLLPPPNTINAVSSRRYFTSQIAHFREPKTPKIFWGTYLHFTQLPCLPWIKVSLFGRNSVDKSVIHLTWIHVVMASSHFRLWLTIICLVITPKNSV